MNDLYDMIRSGRTQSLPIEAAAMGDNSLIAAAASSRVVVIHLSFICRDAVNVRLRSAATNLTGLMNFSATNNVRGLAFDFGNGPIYLGVAEALIANLSAAVGIDGIVTFLRMPA